MLRLALLVIYLAAAYSAGLPTTDVSAGLDPDGLVQTQPPTTDVSAGLDPNG